MANVVDGEPRNSSEWHGSYLDEEGIVADVVAKVKADTEAVKRWLDPVSWKLPKVKFGVWSEIDPNAGCLIFAGMSIRNFYGLWHANNPHTAYDGPDLEITDGIVTDPRHPDNMSERIVEKVKSELGKLAA